MNEDEDYDMEGPFIPFRPLSWWTPVRFVSTLTLNCVRAIVCALDQLDDQLIGAEGYEMEKKLFADGARRDLEMITAGFEYDEDTFTEDEE